MRALRNQFQFHFQVAEGCLPQRALDACIVTARGNDDIEF